MTGQDCPVKSVRHVCLDGSPSFHWVTGADFVRQVMRQLDVSTPAALAEKMRWPRGTERTVARWLTGESEPTFSYTIAMATKAAMFNIESPTNSDQPDIEDRLGGLEVGVARLQESGLQIHQKLDELLNALLDGFRRTGDGPTGTDR